MNCASITKSESIAATYLTYEKIYYMYLEKKELLHIELKMNEY